MSRSGLLFWKTTSEEQDKHLLTQQQKPEEELKTGGGEEKGEGGQQRRRRRLLCLAVFVWISDSCFHRGRQAATHQLRIYSRSICINLLESHFEIKLLWLVYHWFCLYIYLICIYLHHTVCYQSSLLVGRTLIKLWLKTGLCLMSRVRMWGGRLWRIWVGYQLLKSRTARVSMSKSGASPAFISKKH